MQPGADGLQGAVAKATYLGSHLEYSVESPIGELFVIDYRVDAPVAKGTSVTILFAARGVTLVRGWGSEKE